MIVRTVVLIPILILSLLAMLPLLIVCALLGRRMPLLTFAQAVIRLTLAILGLRIDIEGLAGVDRSRSSIFMANHGSMLDGPILFLLIPVAPRIILKKSLFRIPILGWAMRYTGFVPVDRRGENGGRTSIARAARLMRERDYSFLIFPEGTRSRDGRLQGFRRGGFFLAAAARAPIVPVTIDGAYQLMPRGRRIPRRGRIRIVFHPAVETSGLDEAAMPEFAERVRSVIAWDLKGERI
jgi:1-acyl-sn-glycerol-3-phosphate acyltransferase